MIYLSVKNNFLAFRRNFKLLLAREIDISLENFSSTCSERDFQQLTFYNITICLTAEMFNVISLYYYSFLYSGPLINLTLNSVVAVVNIGMDYQ